MIPPLKFIPKHIVSFLSTIAWGILIMTKTTFEKKTTLHHLVMDQTWHFIHQPWERMQTRSYVTLVTRIKPYCFPMIFKRLISVGFQLLISNYRNPTEITLEKTFIQPLKTPTFQTENQPFWNVGNTFFNGCCVTRELRAACGTVCQNFADFCINQL